MSADVAFPAGGQRVADPQAHGRADRQGGDLAGAEPPGVAGLDLVTAGAAAQRAGVEAHRERVGAENPVTLCDVGTLADQAAEPVPPENPDVCAWSRWVLTPGGRALLQRPVGPVNVVMIDIFAQDQPQVPFTGDQHPVQELAAGARDPAFRNRVGPHRQRHPIQMTGTDVSG